MLKTFRDITDDVVFASLLFYGITAAGVPVWFAARRGWSDATS